MCRVTRDHLAAYVAGVRPLIHEKQVSLALDLSTDCGARSWADVEAIRRDGVPFKPSSDPLILALRRIGDPRSWPALRRADHIQAACCARETRYGFARLLLEESEAQVRGRSYGADDGLEHLALAGVLVEAIAEPQTRDPLVWDLKARLALAHAFRELGRFSMVHDPEASRRGWTAFQEAQRYSRRGTGRLKLDLLLARARFALHRGEGVTDFLRSRCLDLVDLVDSGDPLRRLEVVHFFVECQDLAGFVQVAGGVGVVYLRRALVRCWAVLADVLAHEDPVVRLAGLLRMADLALKVLRLATLKIGPRPHEISALGSVADQLAAHFGEFTRHADFDTLRWVSSVIGQLRGRSESIFDPPEVRAVATTPIPWLSASGGSLLLSRAGS